MYLTVIVPVYNEAATIARVLAAVEAADIGDTQREVVVVDDGSTDGTREAIEPFASRCRILRHEKNRGKGAAVRTALSASSGEFVIIQDADLEYDPKDWPALIAALSADTGLAAVYGSRNTGKDRRGYLPYFLGGWLLTVAVNVLCGTRLTDVTTGYKLFRRSALQNIGLRADGFEFDEEVTVKLLRAKGRIGEAPISYRPRTFAEGKKIRPRDGIRGLATIISCRFS